MVHQDYVNSHPLSAEEMAKPYRGHSPGVRGWLSGILVLLLCGGGAAVLLEQYGITNLVADFGRGGRPTWQFGVWQLKDVPDSLVAAPYIHELVGQGIISGYPSDEFLPQRPITRAEFAALVNASFVEQSTPQAMPFEDVADDFWGRDAIANATGAGFFKGYGDNTFRPQQPLARAEAVIALQQGLNIEDPTAILKGQPKFESVDPEQALTRAEAAILIYQTQQALSQ